MRIVNESWVVPMTVLLTNSGGTVMGRYLPPFGSLAAERKRGMSEALVSG
jgi:hypothetical protein